MQTNTKRSGAAFMLALVLVATGHYANAHSCDPATLDSQITFVASNSDAETDQVVQLSLGIVSDIDSTSEGGDVMPLIGCGNSKAGYVGFDDPKKLEEVEHIEVVAIGDGRWDGYVFVQNRCVHGEENDQCFLFGMSTETDANNVEEAYSKCTVQRMGVGQWSVSSCVPASFSNTLYVGAHKIYHEAHSGKFSGSVKYDTLSELAGFATATGVLIVVAVLGVLSSILNRKKATPSPYDVLEYGPDDLGPLSRFKSRAPSLQDSFSDF
mmetsp:Transcript_31518/g.54428  ORF Transcript_31518/g.54428 Transcript_31518/m.54428 type:complete len:267 (-) Transcript_31518:42-842(-)